MKETIYFEAKAKKSKTPIEKTIKKYGIVYPNSSLGFVHAVYAKLEEANGNHVILADSVKDDIPKLLFTQANKNHKREKGIVLGSILDAWINKDTKEIEIVFSFFKSLYPNEWEDAQELMENGELTVSFELKVDKKDIVIMSNGDKKLKHVDFDGVGLLFAVKPAYKNAHVLQLANEIIEKVFEKQTPELFYASAKDAVEKMEETSKIIEKKILEKGGINMDQKVKDALLAKFKDEVIAELGEEAVKDWTAEQWEAELEKRANPKEEAVVEAEAEADEVETPVVEEVVEAEEEGKAQVEAEVETPVVEAEATEEVVEAEKSVVEVEEKVKQKVTYDSETNEETVETESEVEVKRDGKTTMTEKTNKEVTYSYAQMEEAKAEIKAEYEAKLLAKDEEIKFIKENASKVHEIRAEFGEYVADLSDKQLFDEKEMEIAKLKKENAELKAGKETVVASEEVETEEEVDLVASDEENSGEDISEDSKKDNLKALLKKRAK